MPRNTINKVILGGRLGSKPEIRYTPTGAAVVNVSMATNEGYMDKSTQQWVDRTEWHRLVLWNRLADIAKDWEKGDWVMVEGKKQTRKWEDKEGQQKEVCEIIAAQIFAHFNHEGLRSGKGGGKAAAGEGEPGAAPGGGGNPPGDDVPPHAPDDVPF